MKGVNNKIHTIEISETCYWKSGSNWPLVINSVIYRKAWSNWEHVQSKGPLWKNS